MMEITGRRTVPQIFIGETHVGGCDELMALDSRGGLVPLLNGSAARLTGRPPIRPGASARPQPEIIASSPNPARCGCRRRAFSLL